MMQGRQLFGQLTAAFSPFKEWLATMQSINGASFPHKMPHSYIKKKQC